MSRLVRIEALVVIDSDGESPAVVDYLTNGTDAWDGLTIVEWEETEMKAVVKHG